MSGRPLVAIVDDDQSLRDATSNLLQAAGFATATFGDAASFLGSARGRGAACLVADMRMPGMSGLELYESLVAAGSPVPTILITAYPQDAMRARARARGIACCLAKPFLPEELLECIREALAKARAATTPKS
jgi:FixJ family two-component response regulator